ncbi:MLO-like protein 1 [Vigna radiata var. radiata]|uniref:MLO-like protein n=2 Tax=Vigna radiata TaxID=157791 RepID=A0A1S3VCN0_VIGRR|nr:MLO-like protein 1 [Vigna radiata var. radiata]QFG75922.1 MLO-like protein 1 [Vigna radiata]
MGGGGGGEEGNNLEFTPTWVVAVVCSVIVAASFAAERFLHYGGTFLKKKNQKPLYEALLKIKEELMLLGFISLLLTVTQNGIIKICVPEGWTHHMLPCSLKDKKEKESAKLTEHFQTFFSFSHIPATVRHLLADNEDHQPTAAEKLGHCAKKGKVPLLSVEALHHLHIFIFVLAIVHVTFCVLTVVFGGLKIRQWKHWENSIGDQINGTPDLESTVTHVREHAFIQNRFTGFGKESTVLGWVKSFFKQFYGSVTKLDYVTLRLGFIMTHCRGNPKFNFHKYMIRALEDDFKKVVGISWYLWIFVVIFLLLNINGWHTYFWISFVPLILLLAVGTKLEHVIIQLAHEVAEKHTAIEGELVVQPRDDHFWFHRPHIVLFLIHFILFQNAFEIAFFFWILFTYGFDSCIMGRVRYIIPRLVIGVFIQVLCSYSTLPLYAIVTQMGTHFKKAIFDEQVQARLVGWAQKAKKKGLRGDSNAQSAQGSAQVGAGIQLGAVFRRASAPEENVIVPTNEGHQ